MLQARVSTDRMDHFYTISLTEHVNRNSGHTDDQYSQHVRFVEDQDSTSPRSFSSQAHKRLPSPPPAYLGTVRMVTFDGASDQRVAVVHGNTIGGTISAPGAFGGAVDGPGYTMSGAVNGFDHKFTQVHK